MEDWIQCADCQRGVLQCKNVRHHPATVGSGVHFRIHALSRQGQNDHPVIHWLSVLRLR